MKLKLYVLICLSGLFTFSVNSQELAPTIKPPDKEKISYAVGMRLGLTLRQAGVYVDAKAVAQAIKEVLEDKPTRFKESELAAILNEARKGEGVVKMAETDRDKVSYAVGMNRGLQLKRAGGDVDTEVVARALKDVLDNIPTEIDESDIEPLFKQAKSYGLYKLSQKNKAEGEDFLAKNAKEPGITVLPDGLQYRVITEGTGEIPKTNELIIIKYSSKFIDGTDIDHKDYFPTRSSGGIIGIREALQRMKIGSKWELFVPSELAYGHQGQPFHKVGPDTALIYELELVSVATPGDPKLGTGRVGHGMGRNDLSPTQIVSGPSAAIQSGQTNALTNAVPPAKTQ